MPTAICKLCGETMHWRNQRGARLADLFCRCGGRFARAMWSIDQQRYVPRPSAAPRKLGPIVNCVLCGRRARRDGPNFPRRDERRTLCDYAQQLYRRTTLEPGEPACWHHLHHEQLSEA